MHTYANKYPPYFLPETPLSLPHFRLQFTYFYSITNLHLILSMLIQSRHDMNDAAVCVALCVVLCTVCGGFVFDCIWNYNVLQFLLRSAWCCVQ